MQNLRKRYQKDINFGTEAECIKDEITKNGVASNCRTTMTQIVSLHKDRISNRHNFSMNIAFNNLDTFGWMDMGNETLQAVSDLIIKIIDPGLDLWGPLSS